MSALIAVSLGSFGFAKTAKTTSKKQVSKTVVLVKGIQLQHCQQDIKDNGKISIMGIEGINIPVKKGKFDLALPTIPKITEERPVDNSDFGDAKVYSFNLMFDNSKKGDYKANGTTFLSFKILYSDRDVKGTMNEEPVTLKKGWNIIDNKTKPTASCICAG